MAAFDPNAALALDAALLAQAAAADAAAITFETQAAQQLISTITVGDVLPAEVLPPQNGADRISLLGQTVDAQLPPGINPGETILLQVTALRGNQIVVKNLGPADSPEALAAAEIAASDVPEAPAQGVLSTVAQATPGTANPTLPTPPPVVVARDPSAATGAPPQRIDPAALAAQLAQGRPGRAFPVAPPVVAAPGTAPTATPPAGVPAAQTPIPPASASPVAPPADGAPVAPPREVFVVASVQQPQGQRPITRVPIDPRTAGLPRERIADAPPQHAAQVSDRAEVIRAAVEAARRTQAPLGERAAALAPRVTAAQLKEFAPEAALLARLRVPLSASTLVAARGASSAAATLPAAFARLEGLLEKITLPDGRVTTLRALLPFIGRIDLGNARALPQQIASFVSNVLEGTEGKIADLVRLFSASTPNAAPGAPAQQLPGSQAPAQQQLDVLVQAKAAERDAALSQTLKAVIAQVAASNTGSSQPALTQALNEVLRAVTGVQLQALANQDVDPKTLVVALPAQFYDGGKPVEMRVSKDAPNGGKIDPDNFSISFVLDTKTMGTVGIDVRTSGRAVSVNVRTERPRAADRFRTTFEDLRGRLSQLRYRVAAMNADTLTRSDAPAARVEVVDATPQRAKGTKEWRA